MNDDVPGVAGKPPKAPAAPIDRPKGKAPALIEKLAGGEPPVVEQPPV